jgi:hypothetical protein
MTLDRRHRRLVRRAAAAAAVLLAAAALPVSANAYPETWVPYEQLLGQLRSGPLIRAIINPARGDIEIKFRNLDEWHAFYPRSEQGMLQRTLADRHIHTIFVPRHQPARAAPAAVHHHLRYIGAGILAALAAIAAALLLVRSRRRSRAGAPAAGD